MCAVAMCDVHDCCVELIAWGGHGASKSSRDPKTVDYNPRERPEMPEITSFDAAARVVYQGHGAAKSYRDPKTVDYSPRERPEMPEITSFDDAARVVYRQQDTYLSNSSPQPPLHSYPPSLQYPS